MIGTVSDLQASCPVGGCNLYRYERELASLYMADPPDDVAEPSLIEQLDTTLAANDTDKKAQEAIAGLIRNDVLPQIALSLMFGHHVSEQEKLEGLRNHCRRLLWQKDYPALRRRSSQARPSDRIAWPRNSIHQNGVELPDEYVHNRWALIGGPGAAFMGQTLNQVGHDMSQVTAYNPTGNLRGVWGSYAQAGGFINPGMTLMYGRNIIPAEYDSSDQIVRCIDSLSEDVHIEASSVVDVSEQPDGGFTITYQDHNTGQTQTNQVDNVCLSLGNGSPRSLAHGHMQTNAQTLEERYGHNSPEYHFVRRHIEKLSDEDRRRFEGKIVPIIGLGNSFEYMYRQLLECGAEPRVLTHFSRNAVLDPTESHDGDHPVFRSRARLGRYAGDLPQHYQTYSNAIARNDVRAGIRSWNIFGFDEVEKTASIAYSGDSHGGVLREVPAVYALVGNEPDTDLLKRFGCDVDKGELQYNPHTMEVYRGGRSGHGMYTLGAAAGGNHAVIPGMIVDAPRILVSSLIQQERKRILGRG